MKVFRGVLLAGLFLLGGAAARADGFSYVGTLASSTDVVEISLDLASSGDVTLQTYGFGGGLNQAGTAITAGGTDPFLAIFAGSGDAATILTDTLANPFGTSLTLSNYDSFAGCPPAAAENIGGSPQCGDITMHLTGLAAGDYTIVLSDGQYVANAVFDNGTLGEGFSDFTAGAFCNAAINGVDCPNTTGAYAFDVLTTAVVATPEPSGMFLLGLGLAGLACCWQIRKIEA